MTRNLCTVDCRPFCNVDHARIVLEKRIIGRLLRTAREDGWLFDSVYDGEETIQTPTKSQLLDVVFSVDESTIRFRHVTRNVRSWFQVVLGNGVDCLPDCGERMAATYDKVADYCESLY